MITVWLTFKVWLIMKKKCNWAWCTVDAPIKKNTGFLMNEVI